MKKFAVIGSPIHHSISPKIHSEFAKSFRLKITYEAIEVKKSSFLEQIKKLFEDNYDGLNVTLPLKELAYHYADKVSERGKVSGAVNTLWKTDKKIFADTTDGKGFIEDLNNNLISLKNASILIVGAGGSVKSILPDIIDKKPKEVTIINRTQRKIKPLVELFKESKAVIRTSNLQKRIKTNFDGIINASSAGLLGDEIRLPDGIFNSVKWVYDLTYSKEITKFNSLAKENGVFNCVDGLGMLINQASLSFEIWTGLKPDSKNFIKLIRSSL
jgi:shikimate dehydrogenase